MLQVLCGNVTPSEQCREESMALHLALQQNTEGPERVVKSKVSWALTSLQTGLGPHSQVEVLELGT